MAGNVDTCEFKVTISHPRRDLELSLRVLPALEICQGQEVVITPVVSGGSGRYSYEWKPRVWSTAVLKDYPMVNTTYELTVNDGVSPPQTETVYVRVLEPQQVQLVINRNADEIFEGEEVLVTATSGFISYKLLLNNQEMQLAGANNHVSFQAELGTYFVRVFATDFNGCVTQDQMEIEIESKKLPNVFTPNFDGKNDIFLEGFDLKVFNLAGVLLYKGTNGWDGTYRGKMMPQGTYLYVVTRTMNNGEHRIFKGHVTLKL
jgi:gliding motility-associated-like protein